MTNKSLLLLASFLAAHLIRCTVSPVAGGSDNPDFIVLGAIVDTSGQPVQNAAVTIVPASYNPVTDSAPEAAMTDTTNAGGVYRLGVRAQGLYTVQAVHLLQRTRLLVTGISVKGDTTRVATVALSAPGTIKISNSFKGTGASTDYIYVPGTTLYAYLDNRSDSVVLDSVPAGTMPPLLYAAADTAGMISLRYNVEVVPGGTTVVRNPSWKYCRRIIFNTAATGADVTGDVADFPVLIRLNGGNFDFSHARPDGADLRFIKQDDSFLYHEIERWDAAGGHAEVWVKVDTVYGGDSVQSISMYWGNPAATDASNGAAVFDTAAGFQGVWHLGDAGNGPVRDATANRYDGTSPDTARPAAAEGVIGNCGLFDGSTDFITMPNTASGRLDFPEEGDYSIYAWVYQDTFDNNPHPIVAKGDAQYCLQFVQLPVNSSLWEFVEFGEAKNWQVSTASTTAREWTLLIGVRQGNRQLLYCNGALVDSISNEWQQVFPRNTSNNLSIGSFLNVLALPANRGLSFFKGSIDEVRIISTAQNTDWVRLCYMNQKLDDRLVVFE